nr:MAG TPA: hypothetical protein [Caudoviricetes sp.]
MQEIEEIMDEEENNTESNNNNLIEAGSSALISIASLYLPDIRANIREQIAFHKNNKQPFCYYLEMRSFINERCTKVGMFGIGDGNTESNLDASIFLYTIPYVFTGDALIQFLAFIINITGISEYVPRNSRGVFVISGDPTKYSSTNTKKASVELLSMYNK